MKANAERAKQSKKAPSPSRTMVYFQAIMLPILYCGATAVISISSALSYKIQFTLLPLLVTVVAGGHLIEYGIYALLLTKTFTATHYPASCPFCCSSFFAF